MVIVDARLLDPASGLDARGGLLVADGRIAELGPRVTAASSPEGAEVVDARGLCLAPGLVDLRVQLGEPGAEHKERIDSGAAAAAAGGVTGMAVLPNTDPPIDEPAMVQFVARRARQVRLGKVHPYAALTKKLKGEELAEIGLLKAAGAVAFTDGERALADARVMRRALAYARDVDALIVQHPEEPALAEHGAMNEGALASRLGLAGVPAAAEAIMVERDLRLLELTPGGRLHFAHVSTGAAIAAIRAAKARGLRVTCDTAPHYLALNELEVEGYRTFAKVSPPLRGEDDRRAVVEGLRDGTVDAIASDHCPQDQDSKRLPFAQAAFGVIGVETMLPVSLRLVHEGAMTLLHLLGTMTAAPARILGLEAGRLARGAPADLVLFDPEAPWKVTEAGLRSLSKNTAFEGRLVEGRVARTLVDGRTVHAGAP